MVGKRLKGLLAAAVVVAFGVFALGMSGAATAAETGASAAKIAERQLLASVSGEVAVRGRTDRVELYGRHPNKGFFTEDIALEIKNGETGETVASVKPPADAGYKPAVLLADFTGNGISEIFLWIDSGGSGGYQYSYVYSAEDGKFATLWNFEAWDGVYRAEFSDGYSFSVVSERTGERWTKSIASRDQAYLAELYRPDGTLLAPASGRVSGVNVAFPFYNPSAERFGLLVVQKIVGRFEADAYGYVEHLLAFDGSALRAYSTAVNFYGTLADRTVLCDNIK